MQEEIEIRGIIRKIKESRLRVFERRNLRRYYGIDVIAEIENKLSRELSEYINKRIWMRK